MEKLKIKDSNNNLVKLSQDNLEDLYANKYPKNITLYPNESVNTGLKNCIFIFSSNSTDFSIYRCTIYNNDIRKNILGNEAEKISFTVENGSIVLTSSLSWLISVIIFELQY